MKALLEIEDQRANRIAYRINEYHSVLANIYENLVDRDFKTVTKETQFLIMELRCILKSIQEDDF
jgi:hypothetical protein